MKLQNPNSRESELLILLIRGNIQPWQKRVELVAEFHRLKQSEYGSTPTHRESGGKSGWSLRDTARTLGKSLGGVSQDIALAELQKKNVFLSEIKDYVNAVIYMKGLKKNGAGTRS